MEEKKTNVSVEADKKASTKDDEKVDLVLTLYDPFTFDGELVDKIDLNGLFNLRAIDMCELDRQMMREGYNSMPIEITRQYAMLVAAKVNGKPANYCDGMKARDCIRLKQLVTTFFYVRG